VTSQFGKTIALVQHRSRPGSCVPRAVLPIYLAVAAIKSMNLIEIFFLFLAVFLSFRLAVYLVGQIGWWGVVPAVILGLGFVGALLFAARKVFGRHDVRREDDVK
jgi:hypothetical protein